MTNIIRAMELAIHAHGMMARKFHKMDVPFVSHPVRVMKKVSEYLDKWESGVKYRHYREIMLIVCALHDVVEDTDYPLDQIEKEFGIEVADGVKWLTNVKYPPDSRPNRKTRKQIDRDRLSVAPDHWKIIKMWDRQDNLRDMVGAPKKFVLDTYLPESEGLVNVLKKADEVLADELKSTIEWLRQEMKSREE